MQHLFDRVAEVLVGTFNGEEAISVKGLRITFKVRKTMTQEPNTATIEIYNLSQGTRDKITDKNSWVLLRAGYVNDEGLTDVFKGKIIRATHQHKIPDVVTTIEAHDRWGEENKIRISLGYPPNTSGQRILDDIVKKIGLSKKTDSVLTKDRIYKNGFSTVGTAYDALDRVTKFLGLDWSIQNQQIKFTPANGADFSGVILINAASGMLDAPIKVLSKKKPEDPVASSTDPNSGSFFDKLGSSVKALSKVADTTAAENKDQLRPGWHLRCLLRPQIEPRNRVQVESIDLPAATLFVVETVQHSGDSIGAGQWETALELVRP